MKVTQNPSDRALRSPIFIVVAALFALLAASCSALSGDAAASVTGEPRVGSPAPDFTLQDLNGKKVSLKDFEGRPVMVNFWASWCGPCKVEMPHMQAAERELRESTGFVILAINLGEDKKTAEGFLTKNNFDFIALLDGDRSVAQSKYKLIGLPTSFFIDKQGVIKEIQTGPLASKEHLMSKINSIL